MSSRRGGGWRGFRRAYSGRLSLRTSAARVAWGFWKTGNWEQAWAAARACRICGRGRHTCFCVGAELGRDVRPDAAAGLAPTAALPWVGGEAELAGCAALAPALDHREELNEAFRGSPVPSIHPLPDFRNGAVCGDSGARRARRAGPLGAPRNSPHPRPA